MKDENCLKISKELSQMVLSASGWRKVFAKSGNEEDNTTKIKYADSLLVCLAAESFLDFLRKEKQKIETIVLGRDSRPTGREITDIFLQVLSLSEFKIISIGIASAPEIMAYSKSLNAAFIYVSASHNPIGHNGFKFGLNLGGVIDGNQSKFLIENFKNLCLSNNAEVNALETLQKDNSKKIKEIKANELSFKKEALKSYYNFSKEVIANSKDKKIQDEFFAEYKKSVADSKKKGKPLCLIVDFNGSARAVSIDRAFFNEIGLEIIALNEEAGNIQHGILPEGKNLEFCANKMQELHNDQNNLIGQNAILGYMPDCDGDRGNIIYWNNEKNHPEILEAQEVFLLSVIAELAFLTSANLKEPNLKKEKVAVVVNGPTSLRIEQAVSYLGAEVFRAEVGESNVVNLAKDLRQKNYIVRILGEGSNGGNITYPAAVRDPINTIFAILKLLLIKTDKGKKGLFNLWCEKSDQMNLYKDDFSLIDIIKSLPKFTTTPTAEARAILKISTKEHWVLKKAYQKIFEKEWENKKEELNQKLGIVKYRSFCNNGIKQIEDVEDFSISKKGGLKIQFYDKSDKPVGFIWMRGSGTEPIFRIMADVKGNCIDTEKYLVAWQKKMVEKADLKENQ